ncbi:MAG: MCE family protein, partial [Vulcanococcus sp.]
NVTALMHKMLLQTDQEQLLSRFSSLANTADRTAKEASVFLQDGRSLVHNLDRSVTTLQPTLGNLNASTTHLRHVLAALDNPKTIAELQTTVSNAQQLTARWDAVGGDVNKLTADPRFMDGIRSVAVGLGKFFDELYPAQTDAARDKAADPKAAAAEAAKPATPR